MPSAKTSPDGVQGDAGRAEPDNCPTRRAYSSRYGGMMTAGTRAALLLTAFLLGSSLSASSGSAFGLVGNISAGLGEKWGSHLTFLNPINNRGTEPSVNVLLGHRALPILLEGYASETRADGTNDFDDPFQETR